MGGHLTDNWPKLLQAESENCFTDVDKVELWEVFLKMALLSEFFLVFRYLKNLDNNTWSNK